MLVQLDERGAATGKTIAHQVAAMLRRATSPGTRSLRTWWPNERRIAEQVTRDEGKPEQAIPKIVEGRVGAFFKDVVLVEQPSVRDPKKTVKQVLAESGATVKRPVRQVPDRSGKMNPSQEAVGPNGTGPDLASTERMLNRMVPQLTWLGPGRDGRGLPARSTRAGTG